MKYSIINKAGMFIKYDKRDNSYTFDKSFMGNEFFSEDRILIQKIFDNLDNWFEISIVAIVNVNNVIELGSIYDFAEHYDTNFETVPIGGSNPYHKCSSCGIPVPQINGSLINHSESCDYREKIELELINKELNSIILKLSEKK